MSCSGSMLVWMPCCKAEGEEERSSLLPCFLVELHATGPSPAISLCRTLCRPFLIPGRCTVPHRGATCKHSEGALSALVQVLNKDLNRTGPSTEPWGTALVSVCQLDVTPFTSTVWAQPSASSSRSQERPCPSHGLLLCWENSAGGGAKGFAEVEADYVSSLSSSSRWVSGSREELRLLEEDLPVTNPCWLGLIPRLSCPCPVSFSR